MEKTIGKSLLEETKCTVEIDGEIRESDDFVAVLANPDGRTSITYNTDALTLGMAVKMVSRAFVEAMHELTPQEREAVTETLGNVFAEAVDGIADKKEA